MQSLAYPSTTYNTRTTNFSRPRHHGRSRISSSRRRRSALPAKKRWTLISRNKKSIQPRVRQKHYNMTSSQSKKRFSAPRPISMIPPTTRDYPLPKKNNGRYAIRHSCPDIGSKTRTPRPNTDTSRGMTEDTALRPRSIEHEQTSTCAFVLPVVLQD